MTRIVAALLLLSLSSVTYAESYDTAFAKAQEAFLIQSGLNKYQAQIEDYAQTKVKHAVYALVPSTVADPLATAGYALYLGKLETRPLKNPYLFDTYDSLHMTRSDIAVSIEWRF